MKTSSEPKHAARTYYMKAQRFAHAAAANREAGDHDPAVSNAIHAVINVVDALCVHYVGRRNAGSTHADALRILEGLAEVDTATRDALSKRLASLLSKKNLAQYEGTLMSDRDARAAIQDMERAMAAVAPLAKKLAWAKPE